MKNKKRVLPIAIVMASIIFGGFILASQILKNQSLEIQYQREKREKEILDYDLGNCLQRAQSKYQSSMIADNYGELSDEGLALYNILKNDKDECFRIYK